MFVHVTLIPYIEGSGELKSKLTQHSVRELRASASSFAAALRAERKDQSVLQCPAGLYD